MLQNNLAVLFPRIEALSGCKVGRGRGGLLRPVASATPGPESPYSLPISPQEHTLLMHTGHLSPGQITCHITQTSAKHKQMEIIAHVTKINLKCAISETLFEQTEFSAHTVAESE